MHRIKARQRFMLVRNRRIEPGLLENEEVVKHLRIKHFSGFRVFGGLSGPVCPVDTRLAPTKTERGREAAEQSVCISLEQIHFYPRHHDIWKVLFHF